jgi:hypothetical protein
MEDEVGRPRDRGDVLRPFLTFLDGANVPDGELVAAGREIARALVVQGQSISVCGDDHWAGVWDLERFTDREAIDWGLWVATLAYRP